MSVSVCPIAVVAAPVERVWALLADPRQWDGWVDGHVEQLEPPGPACPGQTFVVSTRAFGRQWRAHFTVEAVDEAAHRLRATVRLPLGVTEHAQIGCVALDATTCRVSYG